MKDFTTAPPTTTRINSKTMSELDNTLEMILPNDWAKSDSIIKVLGVGGGGCNAVNYMYGQKIEGCNFIVCNTDAQALSACDVPTKIQLGEGLGAGTDPTRGRNAAIESQDKIRDKILDGNTQMLFITAGMGGGTGSGAIPVIAKMAKDAGILTVGVVTLPFKFEGREKLTKAIDGIHELEKNVDSLITIKNDNLYIAYGDLPFHKAFAKTDEVLCTAVKCVIEIIKTKGHINIDFQDIKNMMKNSGMALMGQGEGRGENRLKEAVDKTFKSPLLNDFDLKTARKVLLNITMGENDENITMNQSRELNDLIAEYTGGDNNFKYGITLSKDPDIHDTIKITAIATGFKFSDILAPEIKENDLIIVDYNYEYRPEGDEVQFKDTTTSFGSGHIGFNTTENKSKIKYDPENKPRMLSGDEDALKDLETTPAIRRSQK